MLPRRRAAFGLWTALTFSAAVALHVAVHAAGSSDFIWDSPVHLAMLLGALCLLAGVAVQLGAGQPAPERRRRIALVRSALGRVTPMRVVSQIGLQIAIAASIFLVEGEDGALDPNRIAIAALCALLALVLSALVFRATEERVIALLRAFSTGFDAAGALRPTLADTVGAPLRASQPYGLFVPNRPPPIPA